MRCHGQVGMPGFRDGCLITSLAESKKFKNHIEKEMRDGSFYRLEVECLNVEHLIYGQPDSYLLDSVKNLIMYLLDQYMPMGILSIKQVKMARATLEKIRIQLTRENDRDKFKKLESLSEEFYQMIPHNGNSISLQIIDSEQKYNSKIEILKRLRSAIKSLKAGRKRPYTNPTDYFTRQWLRTKLDVVDCYSPEYYMVKNCIEKTQHPNDHFLRLKNLFKVSSRANSNFNQSIGNHHLLYHFTWQSNILGILREGLLVAPFHINSKNRFLGTGIYFWDCASIALSKFRDYPSNTAVLIICRVALGKQQLVQQHYLREGQEFIFEDGMNSLCCNGSHYSQTNNNYSEINGTKMFCGNIENSSFIDFDAYNKYMVPNANQVKIEYIAEFEKCS